MKPEVIARIVSSILVVVAFWITLYYDTKCGAMIYAVGNALAMPYMVRQKCWDVVGLLSFLILVGLPKIFS